MIGKRLPEGITKGLPLFHWLLSTSYTSTELSLSTVFSGARPPIAKIFPLRIATAGKLRPCLMEESRRTWIFFSTLEIQSRDQPVGEEAGKARGGD